MVAWVGTRLVYTETFSKKVLDGHWGLKREQTDESQPFFVIENHARQMRDKWKETESFMTPWQLRLFVEIWETGDGISFPNKGVFGTTGDSSACPYYLYNLVHSPFSPSPFRSCIKVWSYHMREQYRRREKRMRVSEESEGGRKLQLFGHKALKAKRRSHCKTLCFFNQPTAGKQSKGRKLRRSRNVKFGHMGRDKRIAKDWRRLGGVVDMQGGCLCLIVCPICLALSLLTTPLASPPPTSPLPPPPPPVPPSPTNSSHPPLYTQSPQPGRWPGVFHPTQLVALFTCTTHICAQLLGCLQSLYSCRPGASAGINTLIHIRWLKGWMGLKGPPSITIPNIAQTWQSSLTLRKISVLPKMST